MAMITLWYRGFAGPHVLIKDNGKWIYFGMHHSIRRMLFYRLLFQSEYKIIQLHAYGGITLRIEDKFVKTMKILGDTLDLRNKKQKHLVMEFVMGIISLDEFMKRFEVFMIANSLG